LTVPISHGGCGGGVSGHRAGHRHRPHLVDDLGDLLDCLDCRFARFRRIGEPVKHHLPRLRIRIEHAADGFQHFLTASLFHDVAASTGSQHALGVERFVVHGNDENGKSGMQRLKILNKFETTLIGERNVRQDEVRLALADELHRLARRVCFAADG
jgi:hypothetical protein